MGVAFFNWFVKITAWPLHFAAFRTRYIYEDADVQRRRTKGPVIIISNHTNVFDYALYLSVFWDRTIRVPMAELLFDKIPLKYLLILLGGIKVDRNEHDFGFLGKLEKVLAGRGAVLAFPESRIPQSGETTPLEFKTSMAYLALKTGVPILPVYTDGAYFKKKGTRVVIGKLMDPADLCTDLTDSTKSISEVNEAMRNKIIELSALIRD